MWDLTWNMAPDTSVYQGFKIMLGQILPVERDILHVVLGAAILGICLLRFRTGRVKVAVATALVVAMLVGAVMETLDAFDDIASFGHWRVKAGLLDFFRTILVPLLAVLYLLIKRRPKQST